MQSQSQQAMTHWIGTLASGGIIRSAHEEAGLTVAIFVVGEDRLSELREWMVAQSRETIAREQRAAIEICIWMANADRKLDPEEAHLLKQLIGKSGLDDDTQDLLVAEVHDPPSLAGVEDRLTHPVLRELLLALSWELAMSDGSIDASEENFATGLAVRLGVDEARAAEIKDAVVARVSVPPAP